jgi:hypothetical protein
LAGIGATQIVDGWLATGEQTKPPQGTSSRQEAMGLQAGPSITPSQSSSRPLHSSSAPQLRRRSMQTISSGVWSLAGTPVRQAWSLGQSLSRTQVREQ